jgi:hypothetical protein
MSNLSQVEIWKGGVFGPSILYSRSTLNTESEYIHIDYDSTTARIRNYSQFIFISKLMVTYIRRSLCQIMKILLIIIFRSCNCRSFDCRSSECRSSDCRSSDCRSNERDPWFSYIFLFISFVWIKNLLLYWIL